MRPFLLLIFGLCWITGRSQTAGPLSADSIPLETVAYDTIPQPLILDTLLTTGYKKLTFPGERSAETPGPKSHLQVGVNYQTDDVYNGRKGNRVIPLITPQISYILKNGLQTDVSVGYDIHDPTPQVNQYTFDVSYNFNPGNGNYSSSLTASRYIYSDQSKSTTAEQRGSFELDNSYDFNVVEAGLYVSWIYGDGKDYAATFSLQHEFDSKNGKLNITPDLSVNAGTQNYYDSYYHHRKYRIGKKDDKPVYEKVLVYGDVINAGKFQALDYELAAPVNYTLGRLVFSLTPTLAVPVNPADIVITTSYHGQVIDVKRKTEELSNSFYVQVGFTYAF